MILSCSKQQPKIYADYSRSSGYTSTATDSITLANLEVLGRVWGYAKYHHPVFADSTLNIDYELFELLPKVAQADITTRNEVLYNWVNGLGEFKSDKSYYQQYLDSTHVFINNYVWTADTTLLSGKLSNLLTDLRYAEREKNVYIEQSDHGIIPPDGIKEKSYRMHDTSDTGYRLLELFRYWNVIDSYCPNRNITDKPWGNVLTEYIPRMINKEQSITNKLIAELNDTHAFNGGQLFGYKTAPVTAKFIENKLIVTDTSYYHSLQKGDEIVSVDGHIVLEVVSKVKELTSHSNNATLLRESAQTIFNTTNDSMLIKYIRNGKQYDTNIRVMTSYEYYNAINKKEKQPIKSFRMINDSIGYIHIERFPAKDNERIMKALENTKALIVDIRCYPQDKNIYYFLNCNFFTTPQYCVIVKIPQITFPGYFYHQLYIIGKYDNKFKPLDNPNAYKGKVILLVNEDTQSRVEFLTMGLQSRPNTITIGSQTAGADGDCVNIPLLNFKNTRYSGLGVLYPDGTDAQRTGVKIDIEVYPTIEGIKAGRDELLEKAIEVINE